MQRVSLLLNVLLLACLVAVLAVGRKDFRGDPPPRQAEAHTSVGKDKEGSPAPTGAEVQPFRWSRIESPDYAVYMANLRGIGCPEQTVHDIIRADVENLYATKRKELHLDEQPAAGPWSRLQESQLLATLLGEETNRVGRGQKQITPLTPVLPLAFRPVNLASLGLTEEQIAAVEEVRQDFVNEIGGLGRDPNDADYANRWQQAQPQSDMMLKGTIGASAYMRYQLEAGD